MSKKKVTLEEAKTIIDSDKVFYNNGRKFNVLDSGKYHSGITIEIPQEWTIDENRKPENPMNYIKFKELTDGMNIDFDGDTEVLLGRYRLSKNGRPVFEITKPTEAHDALIRVSWGGAFEKSSGSSEYYAKEVGAPFFVRSRSNGGGLGCDYWILPVDFVRDMEPRDVSEILSKLEEEQNAREEAIDKRIEREDAEKKDSIENRDRILKQVIPIIKQLQEIDPTYQYEAKEDTFEYSISGRYGKNSSKYTDDLIDELSELLEELKKEKIARDTFMPMFQEVESTIVGLGISITYKDTCVSIEIPKIGSSYSERHNYFYTQPGYTDFVNDITRSKEKIEEEMEEARRKAAELKRKSELKRRKEEAKKMGYPELFEFWNRLGGATNLGHAYVIESNGMIREPDYNDLSNYNSRGRYKDWKNEADGTQGYEQLLPGEIIVTYTKAYRAVPYVFDVEWADGEITEAQLDTICSELVKEAEFATDKQGQEITDIRQWVIDAVRAKAEECKQQLSLQKNQEFAEEILELANEKAVAQSRNEQAVQLAQAYEEEQQKDEVNQPNLEDN